MVYVIQVCRQLSSSRNRPVPSWTCCSKAVYMTHTIAECTVNNSWWWTEELSETCRVSFQNKFKKLLHLVGFIIRKRDNPACRPRQLTKWSEWLWAGSFWIESEGCSFLLSCPSPKHVVNWRSTTSRMQFLKCLRQYGWYIVTGGHNCMWPSS
jgi:hypothetical protein